MSQFVLENCEKLQNYIGLDRAEKKNSVGGLYDKKKKAPHSTVYLRRDV